MSQPAPAIPAIELPYQPPPPPPPPPRGDESIANEDPAPPQPPLASKTGSAALKEVLKRVKSIERQSKKARTCVQSPATMAGSQSDVVVHIPDECHPEITSPQVHGDHRMRRMTALADRIIRDARRSASRQITYGQKSI